MKRIMILYIFSSILLVSIQPIFHPAASEHTTVVSLDFEDDDGSLVHGGQGDLWEWGIPGHGPVDDPGPGSAASGSKAWGCPLDGLYLENTQAYLELPEMDTFPYRDLQISFYFWVDLLPFEDELNESGSSYEGDELILQASPDGTGWLDIWKTNGSSGSWSMARTDLTPHIGGPLHIRFLLRDNGDGHTDNGAFIDLIELSADTKEEVDITLSSRSFIPPVVASGESSTIFLEALNRGRQVPEDSMLTLYIETAGGEEELTGSVEVTTAPTTSRIIEWYPSSTGNFRGWINLTLNGSYHQGSSFNIISHSPVFLDTASFGVDHWNVGDQQSSVTWDTVLPEHRPLSMSGGATFWAGGAGSGPNGTNGFTGNTEVYLESDWIDLSYYTASFLHIYHRYDLQGVSGGVVQALDPGNRWKLLEPMEGSYGTLDEDISSYLTGTSAFMGSMNWTPERFDLGDHLGERTRIRFILVSGDTGYGEGWYMDDVMVSGKGYDPLDEDPPAMIEGLEAEVVDEGAVSLEWYPSLALDFSKYNIYLEEVRFDTVKGLDPYETLDLSELNSIILTDLDPERTYWAAVTAVDHNDNEQEDVTAVSFRPTMVDPNRPPVAVIEVEGGFHTRKVGEDVVLDGSGSYDPEGDRLTYVWILPDDEIRRGPRIIWRSESEGDDLLIVLEVLDEHGKSSRANVTLSFEEEDQAVESGQSIGPFLIFISPFALIALVLLVMIVYFGKGRRRDLEKRLRKIGLEMDGEGKLVSVESKALDNEERKPTSKTPQVLDMVPKEKKKEAGSEGIPEWEEAEGSPKERPEKDLPVKVVLECPYCGDSFKMSVEGSVIRSGSPFDIECPHCGGSGKITP
ncbi:MAG: hypothetical protein R6V01_04595 [Thermoplasmatota archaeon]